METAEDMILDCQPRTTIYPAWPEKPKTIKKTLSVHRSESERAIHTPYYDKPKKSLFCAIKQQTQKGKIMTAHLARQI